MHLRLGATAFIHLESTLTYYVPTILLVLAAVITQEMEASQNAAAEEAAEEGEAKPAE